MDKKLTGSIVLLVLVLAAGFLMHTNNAFGLSIDAIHYLSTPSLHNLSGDKIDSIEVGQQSVIELSIHNNDPTEHPFVILVEIRNSNDVTTDVFWQSGSIDANGNYTMETSWTPREKGINYQIRSFAVSDLDNPQVLSAVSSREEINVVESPLYQFCCDISSTAIIMNTSHSFEYSLDSGYVAKTQADFDTLSMLLTFEGISRDSYLTIRLSAPLMDMFFPTGQTVDLEHLEDKLVLFLDEMEPLDYEIVGDSQNNIVTIGLPIPAESQKLEIIRDIMIN